VLREGTIALLVLWGVQLAVVVPVLAVAARRREPRVSPALADTIEGVVPTEPVAEGDDASLEESP
jgi:hypothetical protein